MKRGFLLLGLALVCLLSAVGCGKQELTEEEYLQLIAQKAAANQKQVALEIEGPDGTISLTMDWLVYCLAYNEKQGLETLKNYQSYYETMYGKDYNFWKLPSSSGEGTMADAFKDAAFSSIVYTAIMYEEAVKAGTELTDSYLLRLDSLTDKFLAQYTLAERARCGMSRECIRENYKRLFLVDLYTKSLEGAYQVDEEAIRESIREEDYRVYQTEYLYVSKSEYDENFQNTLTEEEVQKRKAASHAMYEKICAGDSFLAARKDYEEICTYATLDFSKSQMNAQTMNYDYMQESILHEVGEVFEFETKSGYYVIRIQDDSKVVGYEDAVQAAINEARAKGISEVYTELEKQYQVTKTEVFEKLTFGSFAIIPSGK